MDAPFPEEFNRKALAAAVHTHFAPTQLAAANLRGEGVEAESILDALLALARERPDSLTLTIPVHPNPAVSLPVRRRLAGVANVRLLPPLDYPDFLRELAASDAVLTDSGGVQEEAPAVGVPVLVLRDVTERPEVVTSGWGRLVGTDAGRILLETRRLLDDPREARAMRAGPNPFGDGHAAERIVAELERR